MNSLYSQIESPELVDINDDAFFMNVEGADNMDFRLKAVLYIPIGSIEAYKKINVWRKFRDIIEIDVNDMERHQNVNKRV